MTQLTERCDIWRMVGTYDGGKTIEPVYTRVPCLKIPISSFDKVAASLVARNTGATESFRSEGRSSTDAFLLPCWVHVQEEDELRRGRRIDITGAVQSHHFTVDGIRDYEGIGYQDVFTVYCTLTK